MSDDEQLQFWSFTVQLGWAGWVYMSYKDGISLDTLKRSQQMSSCCKPCREMAVAHAQEQRCYPQSICSCLTQSFHRRNSRNDQRPLISDDNGNAFGFSLELFMPGCGLDITGCQSFPPWVALT